MKCIIKTIVESELNDCLNGKSKWFTNVRTLLYKYGFLCKWSKAISTRSANLSIDYAFRSIFQQRLINEFTQEWRTSINNTGVLILYKYVKDTLECQICYGNEIEDELIALHIILIDQSK
jgi:hypothetical protein